MKYSSLVKKFMLQTGLMQLPKLIGKQKKVAILRYHSVTSTGDNFYASPSISLSPETFEKQVAYFCKNYSVVSLDEVCLYLQDLRKIPNNSVVFTFDDGYADNYKAYQILKK